MKLSKMLATITMCSSLLFVTSVANAKTKRHGKHGKKSVPAKVVEETSVTADSESAPSSTSTTTTTTTDKPAMPPEESPPAPPPSDSSTTIQESTTTTDTTVAPVVPPAPEAVPPPPTTTTTTTTTHGKVVFLPMVAAQDRSEYGYQPPIGFVISAGGGAADFIGGTIKAMTGTAGAWNVRFLVGSRSIVGFEAAYNGSIQSISALGLENNAHLMSHGGNGAFRLNAPIAINKWMVEPYGFGGVGWQRFSVVNSNTNSASLSGSDNVLTVPAGGGLAVAYSGFFLDARYTYQFTYLTNLVLEGTQKSPGLDTWNIGGSLGYEF